MRQWNSAMTAYIRGVFFLAGLACSQGMADQIHRAAEQGRTADVMAAIEAGTPVDVTDGDGKSLLWIASHYGQLELAKSLLEAGANANLTATGPYGSLGAPIHAASSRNHIEVVRILLEIGVDPNFPDRGVGPPLHISKKNGYDEITELLIESGANESATVPSIAHILKDADITIGKKMAGTCIGCHLLDAGTSNDPKFGPTLWNILNRPKANVAGFEYSEALRAQGGVWDFDAINNLLAAPRSFLPGTKMDFFTGISSPERRAAIIAYLRTLSNEPVPLP